MLNYESRYVELKDQIERVGFEVAEGSFISEDGRNVAVMLTPVDPEALVYAAARVYTDRSYVRRQKVAARAVPS
jgi:predicted site-specific integrase-resolvase